MPVNTTVSRLLKVGGQPDPAAAPPITDATQLAQRRTELASDRSFLAAERTLMGWIRTSLSMISFGFTITKFLEAVERQGGTIAGPVGRSFSAAGVGFTLVVIGTLALVVAVYQHRHMLRLLRAEGRAPTRFSLSLVVATVVALLGVFLFGSLALHY